MPTQKCKVEIIQRLQAERRRLEHHLEGLSSEVLVSEAVVGAWTIKDVLAHLAAWEAGMLRWIAAARMGQAVVTPDDDLTWKQLDEFNRRVYQKYRDMPLADVQAFFHAAHQALMDLSAAMTDEELLTPGFHAFTGKGAVYNWLSAYAAHDRWATTEILQWKKKQAGGLLAADKHQVEG